MFRCVNTSKRAMLLRGICPKTSWYGVCPVATHSCVFIAPIIKVEQYAITRLSLVYGFVYISYTHRSQVVILHSNRSCHFLQARQTTLPPTHDSPFQLILVTVDGGPAINDSRSWPECNQLSYYSRDKLLPIVWLQYNWCAKLRKNVEKKTSNILGFFANKRTCPRITSEVIFCMCNPFVLVISSRSHVNEVNLPSNVINYVSN